MKATTIPTGVYPETQHAVTIWALVNLAAKIKIALLALAITGNVSENMADRIAPYQKNAKQTIGVTMESVQKSLHLQATLVWEKNNVRQIQDVRQGFVLNWHH